MLPIKSCKNLDVENDRLNECRTFVVWMYSLWCMCEEQFSGACSVLRPQLGEDSKSSLCLFFFFARSQGCWDNLEIRSLPEAKIVFTSGQNYLTLLSNSQMIFHCNIPWFQNAWTYTSMSKLPSNGALYLNQESQSMKTHPIYTRFVSTCSDVRCVC